MQHTPWIQRIFNFDYPVTHFPFFIERLRGSYPRLVALVDGCDEALLSAKAAPAWSLKEHIGHLSDLEILHERRIDDYMQGKEVLSAADMSNRKTEDAGHNQQPVDALLQEFFRSRQHFIQRLTGLNEEMLSRTALHPRLQRPMRLVDMVFFVAEHDDHHFTLMRNLLKESRQ